LTAKNPYEGISYYPIKLNGADKLNRYSDIRTVTIAELPAAINLFPKQAVEKDRMTINAE